MDGVEVNQSIGYSVATVRKENSLHILSAVK